MPHASSKFTHTCICSAALSCPHLPRLGDASLHRYITNLTTIILGPGQPQIIQAHTVMV